MRRFSESVRSTFGERTELFFFSKNCSFFDPKMKFGNFLLLFVCVTNLPIGLCNDRNLKQIEKIIKHFYEIGSSNFSCQKNCTLDGQLWGTTKYVCTKQGEFVNNFCVNAASFSNCVSLRVENNNVTKDWTVLNPGTCDCPSDCVGHGTCRGQSGCGCDDGYTGVDCASVDCSKQTCSNRGYRCDDSLFPDMAVESCICETGYALADCSATMEKLPPIPLTLSIPQYTSWDQYDDNNPIFNESTIAQIYLTISEEDLAFLINPANQDVRDYKHANFSFYNGATYKVLEDVGLRIQGGGSRAYAKKSWKISFDTFVSGRSWAQQKKVSLKDAAMDPLYVREKTSMAAIYSMGGPVYRGSHAVVYINGMLWGLYILLEDCGSNQFLKSRFGNDDGSLWKCNGNLHYISNNSDAYRNSDYKAMNDNAQNDYSPLANFISILNLTPDDEFEEQIQTVFNVEFFLRTFSAEVATGNWDGTYNANNYYLYYNTDELFYYYRHDLDVSFGNLDWQYRMSNRSIWEWGTAFPPGRGRLLIDRILAVESFQEIYSSYLSKLMNYVNPDQSGDFAIRVNGMHSSVTQAAEMDAWHSLDNMMYSFEEFGKNLNEPALRPNLFDVPGFGRENWPAYNGFYPWIKRRNDFTTMQLQTGPPS